MDMRAWRLAVELLIVALLLATALARGLNPPAPGQYHDNEDGHRHDGHTRTLRIVYLRERGTMNNTGRYVPALGYDWLTGLYDPIVVLATRERTFKRRLLQQADIREGHRVLDLACGTGTLAIWAKQGVTGAEVLGIDGDRRILSMAQRKAQTLGVEIVLDHGFSTELPYESSSFNRVLSSLFFHHLSREEKVLTAMEVCRVLKPGGEFHIADWGRPQNGVMRTLFYTIQLLDGFANTRDNVQGLLPQLVAEGGFEVVEERDEIRTPVGTMALYSARKSACRDVVRAYRQGQTRCGG
jgi:ubiquinone/menaquinone biosynthesis C-methylase UbiE